MAMSLNMILVVYVIPCILSYDFNKLTIFFIHVGPTYISFICMTIKSVMTFFSVNKISLSGSTGSNQTISYDTSSYNLNHRYIVQCNNE